MDTGSAFTKVDAARIVIVAFAVLLAAAGRSPNLTKLLAWGLLGLNHCAGHAYGESPFPVWRRGDPLQGVKHPIAKGLPGQSIVADDVPIGSCQVGLGAS